eukprot:TRINITY_DN5216_c0_g1_i2.p1 TRINITY_DN5216_c0_g1~~TRINITY_DN5216_c0_g1_i2.p1  ORF type:complete len:141 (-),score=21.17 TRINITY_DN5216_c0_g1_i2:233-655(-)
MEGVMTLPELKRLVEARASNKWTRCCSDEQKLPRKWRMTRKPPPCQDIFCTWDRLAVYKKIGLRSIPEDDEVWISYDGTNVRALMSPLSIQQHQNQQQPSRVMNRLKGALNKFARNPKPEYLTPEHPISNLQAPRVSSPA